MQIFFVQIFFLKGFLKKDKQVVQIGPLFLVLFEGALEEGRFVVLFLARHLEKPKTILSEGLLHR